MRERDKRYTAMMKRRGFTLIEMIAVVLIMGLLTGAAVLTLARTVDAHRYEDVCGQLERADGIVRSAARQSGKRQVLLIDLDKSEVDWQPLEDAMTTRLVAAGRSCTIETLKTAEQTFSSGSNGIEISASGYSPTYGLLLVQPDGSKRWLIVAGMTGQTRWMDDERQVGQIFDTLADHSLHAVQAPAGNDAH